MKYLKFLISIIIISLISCLIATYSWIWAAIGFLSLSGTALGCLASNGESSPYPPFAPKQTRGYSGKEDWFTDKYK